MTHEKEAVEALKQIVLDPQRVMVERQRAVDAITLFPSQATTIFEHILKRVDSSILREQTDTYLRRIKAGQNTNMTL